MNNLNLEKLVQALDAATRRDLECAAERCVARGGSQVLLEDLLLQLLERPAGLLGRALQDAGVEAGLMHAALLPGEEPLSGSRNPVFAAQLVQWLQDAMLVASLELGQPVVDEAALILALLNEPMRYIGSRYQPLLARLDAARLKGYALAQQEGGATVSIHGTEDSLLQRFTHDLTAQAHAGKLDPVLCRDEAIAQLIDILARRRKNNPIVVGEAGVGKTALVEGLALRIVANEVPAVLQNVRLLMLDIGLLQAGASVKGEFERRLQGVIDGIKTSAQPVIVFVDEAHTLIGAGNPAGGADAANLLKPALARGELRMIAATTFNEYKKYFEKDPALARRFQQVQVQEPSVEQAVTILRGLAPVYEKSHGIYLRDDAVVAAAQLSARYLAARQLPDKAVDVLDTACARVRISLAAAPRCVEQLRSERAEGHRQLQAVRRDREAGLGGDERETGRLQSRLIDIEQSLTALETEWHIQRRLAEQLLTLRQQLVAAQQGPCNDGPADEAVCVESLLMQVSETREALVQAQASQRLVSYEVCPRLVAEVIHTWTGIPVEQLAREHNARVASFASDLKARIRGQDQAVEALARAMQAAATGLNNPDAPLGVFLLVGPSGVGKTETALALADLLYGGERFVTTINMSEFQERHSVSRLIGAPPGYVGYGEGGMLTEAVRQKPYSVVLLDEVEKADPDVLNLFYQIFDKGVVNDGEGRAVDFRNTLILLTSNLASERIEQLCAEGARPDVECLQACIQPTLSQHFKPALLARMRVVPYYPISGPVLHDLIELKLQRLAIRLQPRQLSFGYDPQLVQWLAERCGQQSSGARLIDQLLENQLMPRLSERLLQATQQPFQHVQACISAEGEVCCVFS